MHCRGTEPPADRACSTLMQAAGCKRLSEQGKVLSELVRGLQSTQQGGTLVFKGTTCTWAYYDEATAAHATPEQIIDNALAA